jgi:hypothetical protein
MASLGILDHVGEKRLGRFRAVRYPEKDHAPEAALLKKIRAAYSGDPSDLVAPDSAALDAAASDAEGPDAAASDSAAPDAGAADATATDAETSGPAKPDVEAHDGRTTALIALLQAAGLLGKLFPSADKVRASELAKDYWPSRAVEDELRMIRLAEEEAATL